MEQPTGPNGALFLVFVISIYTLVLLPYTIYKLCNSDADSESDEVLKPWLPANKRRKPWVAAVRRLASTNNIVLVLLWMLWFAILWYISATHSEQAPFNPYDILELEVGASERDVKRAYRQLSLKFHPDKNPDPKAGVYFAEYITKAYQALTDETSRKNYEKYGHPDGEQAVNLGVALPEWLFSKDTKSAPWVLAALVGGGILLPLAVAACYLLSSNKYVGPNNIMEETIEFFVRSSAGVRESQGLPRIMDTLTVAMEYINMPALEEQMAPLEQLRKDTLRNYSDLRDKKTFWQRKNSCVKAHMLLLAHLAREEVPPILLKDQRFVLKKAPVLVEEIIKIAGLPRPVYGWLAPLLGGIEFMQHLVQAVPVGCRKNHGQVKGGVEGLAPLLQLPHLDVDAAKKLGRRRVRSLADLAGLPSEERAAALQSCGLDAHQVQEVGISLESLPNVTISDVRCEVEGEDGGGDIMQGDLVTCSARLTLTRPSHATTGFTGENVKGRAVAAFAPHFPFPKEENWYVVLADPAANQVLSVAKVSLLEAEAIGASRAAASTSQDGTNGKAVVHGKVGTANGKEAAAAFHGQLVQLKFVAFTADKRDLLLLALCDSWIGCDRSAPLRLKVTELSRAEREGRGPRGHTGKMVELDEDGALIEDSEDDLYALADEDQASEEEEEEGDGYDDYDTDETGSEESGSDADEDEAKDAGPDGDASDAGSTGIPEQVPAPAIVKKQL